VDVPPEQTVRKLRFDEAWTDRGVGVGVLLERDHPVPWTRRGVASRALERDERQVYRFGLKTCDSEERRLILRDGERR
jgi:hypothetical protein